MIFGYFGWPAARVSIWRLDVLSPRVVERRQGHVMLYYVITWMSSDRLPISETSSHSPPPALDSHPRRTRIFLPSLRLVSLVLGRGRVDSRCRCPELWSTGRRGASICSCRRCRRGRCICTLLIGFGLPRFREGGRNGMMSWVYIEEVEKQVASLVVVLLLLCGCFFFSG